MSGPGTMSARGHAVARLQEIWRYPVKSMAGERLATAECTATGIAGDRAFALFDVEQETVVFASNTRHYPGLLDCQATFVAGESDIVRVTLPDGRSATSDSAGLDSLLRAHFCRAVRLIRTVPSSYLARQRTFFGEIGLPLAPPPGRFVDLCSVSIITAATLTRLSAEHPASRFDVRRFRMNLVLGDTAPGFPEDGWVGRRLQIGAGARLIVTMPDPRCSMTTLSQDGLPQDPDILRAVTRLNSVPVGTGGPLPCAGVYADMETTGTIHAGDACLLA